MAEMPPRKRPWMMADEMVAGMGSSPIRVGK